MRQHALEMFQASIAAVHPARLMPAGIAIREDVLQIAGEVLKLKNVRNIFVVGAGKASAAMAFEAERILGNRITGGLIVTKYGHAEPLQRIRCIEAGHPLPDVNSILAGEMVLDLLQQARENDIVIALISGGASALLADTDPNASLEELQRVFQLLLNSGADIHELNTVRKHLSPRIKGGQLARAAFPARLFTLVISDVVGDELDVIASGPTVPDRSTFGDAERVLEQYSVWRSIPAAARDYILNGVNGIIPETPKPGDKIFAHVHNSLIGSNSIALDAALQHARSLGYRPRVVTDALQGNAVDRAVEFVDELRSGGPACLLMGGETTVQVTGNGKGGRNQHFVLAATIEMMKTPGRVPVILSAGTDGTDGPTDAAGAVADDALLQKVHELSIDPKGYLLNNNAYAFFEQVGGLVVTGPTKTNVMDIVIGIIG